MNESTFQGNGKVTYVPVIVNGKQAKQTNADRIRKMTDEELNCYIGHLIKQGRRQVMFDYECGLNWLKDECDKVYFEWLKQESQE